MPGACRAGREPDRANRQPARARLAQHPAPVRKLAKPPRLLRVRRKPLRPPTKRGAPRHQRWHKATRRRLPRRRKIRHQDAPRNPVHRKMMNGQQQPASRVRPGIEPHRLHHHPGRRSKPALGRLRLLGNAGPQPLIIKPANVDPPQAVASHHRASRRNLQRPRPLRRPATQTQPQRIVMIKQVLQGPDRDDRLADPPAPEAASPD